MTMANLGSKLKDLRESKGLSINDIAEKIKVSPKILESIESGDREALPHTVYAKGFISSFALVLGYDQEELATDLHAIFDTELPEDAHTISGPLGRPFKGGRSKFSKFLLAVIIIGGLGACIYQWHSEIYSLAKMDFVSLIKKPFMAETIKPAIPLPVKPQTTPPTPQKKPELKPVSDKPVVKQNIESDVTSEEVPMEQGEKASTAEDSSAKIDELVSQELQEKHVVKIIVDKEQCWIGSETDGGAQKSETLRVGQEREYPYTTSLRLILGNPSAVILTHDGDTYDRQLDGSRREILQFP